jgi:hypothetical protein
MIKLIDLLREAKQVGDIYHYTRLEMGLINKILKSGQLKPSGDRLENKGYISFSRDRALGLTLGPSKTQVRITIDGDKLSNKYKIFPYAQQEPETKRDKENWVAPFSRSTQDSESELVIPAKKYGGSIDILPYIKKIDVIANNYDRNNFFVIKQLAELEEMCKQLNIPVEFHAKKGYDDEGYWSPSKYTRALKPQFYDDKQN